MQDSKKTSFANSPRDRTGRLLIARQVLWMAAAGVFILTGFLVIPAQAEWYLTGHMGVAVPGSLSNSKITSPTLAGGVTDARIADVDQESTLVYGAKVGAYLPRREWLGFEGEVFTQQLNITQQTVVGGVPGRVFADTLPGAHVQLTTVAANVIVRDPSLVEQLVPYGGVGPALFFSSIGNGTTHATLGLNLIAGARYFVTAQTALFGEFKYDRATTKFHGIQGDYSAQVFVFGISVHFDRIVPAQPAP